MCHGIAGFRPISYPGGLTRYLLRKLGSLPAEVSLALDEDIGRGAAQPTAVTLFHVVPSWAVVTVKGDSGSYGAIGPSGDSVSTVTHTLDARKATVTSSPFWNPTDGVPITYMTTVPSGFSLAVWMS